MSANGTAAVVRSSPDADGGQRLLAHRVTAARLGVSESNLKRLHFADPAGYPAKRIGRLWRWPEAWVDAKTAWPAEAAS